MGLSTRVGRQPLQPAASLNHNGLYRVEKLTAHSSERYTGERLKAPLRAQSLLEDLPVFMMDIFLLL